MPSQQDGTGVCSHGKQSETRDVDRSLECCKFTLPLSSVACPRADVGCIKGPFSSATLGGFIFECLVYLVILGRNNLTL